MIAASQCVPHKLSKDVRADGRIKLRSAAAGEDTAKGSLNVKNTVMCRSALLDRFYDDTDTGVIHAQG